MAWRIAYERHLPKGTAVIKTDKRKNFRFANGRRLKQLEVFKLPIAILGMWGMVTSTEIPAGTTPLLLSILTLEALDAEIKCRKRLIYFGELNVEVPMLKTRTNHVGIVVTDFYVTPPPSAKRTDGREPVPGCVDNFSVYLSMAVGEAQKAFNEFEFQADMSDDESDGVALLSTELPKVTRHRGVRPGDETGIMKKTERARLAKTAVRLGRRDRATWAALKTEYSIAEKYATRGFKTTVIFEPWGGNFVVTRVGSKEHGWTNSQPLDIKDGYDLRLKKARELIFNLLEQHDPFFTLMAFDCKVWSQLCNANKHIDWEELRHNEVWALELVYDIAVHRIERQRYFLNEQPAGAESKNYNGILNKLFEYDDVKSACGDQCRLGKIDSESGKPVRKRSWYQTNCQFVLNRIALTCECQPNTHEEIQGQNKFGPRSTQAAAYTWKMGQEICFGVKEQMQMDYALDCLGEFAYPVTEFPDYEPDDPEWAEANRELEADIMEPLPKRVKEMMKIPLGDRGATPPPPAPARIRPRPQAEHQEVPADIREAAKSAFMRPTSRKEVLRGRPKSGKVLRAAAWQKFEESDTHFELVTQILEQATADLETTHTAVYYDTSLVGQRLQTFVGASYVVRIAIGKKNAKRLMMPEPHMHRAEAPLRSALMIHKQEYLHLPWEEYQTLSVAQRTRPIPEAKVLVLIFAIVHSEQPEEDDKQDVAERTRIARWNSSPRELRMAIRHVHENLGHPRKPELLRALKIGRASPLAVSVARLFKCDECDRIRRPDIPVPSGLPKCDEFNVLVGFDCFEEKDADGTMWTWLAILCMGSTFMVCVLLAETHKNPTGEIVLEAYELSWENWAGLPEAGIVIDRAKYFLGKFAEYIAENGCTIQQAAKASPWQLSRVNRHIAIWKWSWRRVCYAKQVAGRLDCMMATAEVNRAKNDLSRKAGFSPAQWVIGRNARLPADLLDDGEAERIGSLSAAESPQSRFARKVALRAEARKAIVAAAYEDSLRRAEIRQVRPTRGPFHVGDWVFYYDQQENIQRRPEGPENWIGLARVIGHEGRGGVWLSHRGILILCSPEHLARATDEEVRQWMAVSQEVELIDTTPLVGGAGFIDMRNKPAPPQEQVLPDTGDAKLPHFAPPTPPLPPPASPSTPQPPQNTAEWHQRGGSASDNDEEKVTKMFCDEEEMLPTPVQMAATLPSVPALSLSPASAVEAHAIQNTAAQQLQQQVAVETVTAAVRTCVGDTTADVEVQEVKFEDWNPERDGYRSRQEQESTGIEVPSVDQSEQADDLMERIEREKRRKSLVAEHLEQERQSIKAARRDTDRRSRTELEEADDEALWCVDGKDEDIMDQAMSTYEEFAAFYVENQVSKKQFGFGVLRNEFDYAYAVAPGKAPKAAAKRGRREVELRKLAPADYAKFAGPGGSDEKEWQAWLDMKAGEPETLKRSEQIREEHPDKIIPLKWVRTNKNEGQETTKDAILPMLAKSRLVVQGFKDKMLGFYRRDAPTASRLAESLVLCLIAVFGFVMACGDIKNAYFKGQKLDRDVWLEQPRGGLPGLHPRQLIRAIQGIYGFAEAARLFWLAFMTAFVDDGWRQSKLEAALFFKHLQNKLVGVACTHVDDVLCGLHRKHYKTLLTQTLSRFNFAKWQEKQLVFRGREMEQLEDGSVSVRMRAYANSMKKVKIDPARRKELTAELDEAELNRLRAGGGELGWISRQLRFELQQAASEIQRAKVAPCVADLVKLNAAISEAKRGADFALVYPTDLDIENAVVCLVCDSGHANGPEVDDIQRYRSYGGHFLILANPDILDGAEATIATMDSRCGLTQRVCRSTLAAEASHLAEAVESGDWLCVLLDEVLHGQTDLRNWQQVVEKRRRLWITDCKSVYDYLTREGTSTSKDKRMAIEGALLREALQRPGTVLKWIDGGQNLADVLTKWMLDKTYYRLCMRQAKWCIEQHEAAKEIKCRKQAQRAARKIVLDAATGDKKQQRRAQAAAEARDFPAEESEQDEP